MKPAHTHNERRGFDMNIGDKIPLDDKISTIDTKIVEIVQIIPAKYRDDGEEQWYEVVDPIDAEVILVECKDHIGNEVSIIFGKEANLDLLLDLL